ncbi:MAG: FG-GAP repeat protein, partial [Candidatus Omnitrophica bacterium]|nr:FG-GAP repeat protein [Candidatus Omnitrophota bacterium]
DFQGNTGEFTQEGGSAYFVDCRFSSFGLGSGLLDLRADLGFGGGVADITATNCTFCGSGGAELVDIDEGNAAFQHCIFTSTDSRPDFPCIRYNPETYDNDFFNPLIPPSLTRPTSLRLENCDLHNPLGVGIATGSGAYDPPKPPGSILVTDTIIVANQPIQLLNPTVVPGSTLDIQYNDLFIESGWTEVTPGAWSGVIANNLHEDPAYEDPSQCDPAGFLYHNATLATAGMSGGQLGAVGFSGVSLTPTFTPTPTSTIPSPTPTPTSTCDPFSYPLLNPACAGASPLSENFDVWPDFLPLDNGFRNFDVAPLGPDPGTLQQEFILFGIAEEPSCGPAKATISPQGIVRPKSNVYIDDLGAVVDMQGAAASFYGINTGFGWNTHVDSDPDTGQYVVGQHYNNDPGYAFPNTLAAFDYIQSGIPPVTLDHGIFQRFERYGNKISNLTAGRNIPSTVSHTELPYFPADFHSSRINGVSILSDGNTLYSLVDRSRSGGLITDVGVVEYFRDHGIVPNLNNSTHRCNVHTITTPDASNFVVSTTPTIVDPATGLTTDSIAYQGVDAGEGFFAVRSSFFGGTLAVFRNDGTRIAQIFNYNALIVYSGLLPYPNDGTLSISSTNTLSCSNDTIYMTALYRPQAGGVLRPCVLRFRVDNLQTVTPLPVIAGYEDSVATLDQISANTMDVYATPEGDFALAWREGVGDGGAPVVRVFNQDGTPATSTFYPSSIPSPDMDIAYSAFSNSSATIKVALHDNTLCVVWLSENGVSTVSEPDCGGQPKLPALSTVARLFHVPVCESCPPPYYSVSLDEAVDSYSTPIWSYGDAAWTGLASASYDPTGNISVDGFDGAQSGPIGDNGWSTLATTVHGPGTASFYWKVSSEANHDFLTFLVDGFPVEQLSGSTDWAFFSTQVSSGPHSLEWRYEKDGSGSSGADLGRVDLFNWTYGCTTYVSGGVGLQDAINSTQSGCEIVILDSATYVEDLYIPPTKTNLTIRAQYGQTPVIRAANNTGNRGLIGILFNLLGAAGAPDHYGMIIEGNGTQLLGLTLENDGPANTPFGHGSAVLVMADNVRLESCTIRGAADLSGDQAGLALASGDWASLESLFPGAFTSAGYGVIRGDNLSVWYCNFDRGNIELATLDYANAFGLYVTGTYYNPVVHPQNGYFLSCVFSNGDRVAQNSVGWSFYYNTCTFQNNTGAFTQEGGSAQFFNCDFRDNLSSTRPLVNMEADLWFGGGVSDVLFHYCRFCGAGGSEFVRVEEGNADFQYCIFSSASTDPAYSCVRYNPQRFDGDFFSAPFPVDSVRPSSVRFDHCDVYNPMGIGLVTDAEPFDSPNPTGAIWIRNTILVAHEGVKALHTSVVPGSLLTIEDSDLWTTGAQVTNMAWPSVLSGNLSEDPLYRNPGPCDPYGYAHGNFAFVSRLPGGAGSQGYQQLIVSLPEALDNSDLVWETGGGAVWVGIDETSFNPGGETSFDGDDAARSGTLWDNETSFFQSAVSGPGMLDFEWRVSSELNHDVLSFLVDNAEYTQISGITGWQHVSLQISEGPHTLQWRYAKDGAGAAGLDLGRVDRAVWAPENHIPLSSADSSFLGEYQWGHSGSTVAGLGDVNGDEYDDFLIGAPGVTPVGKTYLIFGNESEFGSNNYLWYSPASFIGEYIAPYWRVNEVAGVGDVNGDGLNDFLIGARTPNHSNQIEVKAFLFHGDETDFGPDQPLSRADASFISPQISDIYPYRSPKFHVTGAGDVNADGFDDFLIGVGGNDEAGLNTGKVFLFFGNETDFSADTPLSDADASYSGESPFDELSSVAGVGDVNGDGFDDFLLGAFRNDTGGTGSGKSYLFLGNETDFGPNRSVTTADASFVGEYSADYSGFSVAGVGDMNGDGLDDFLIGAPMNGAYVSYPYQGKAYLILGRTSADWGQNFSLANADASFLGSHYASHLGDVVTGGMDVDGDGYDDLLIRGNKDFDSSYVYLIRGGIGPWIGIQTVESRADIVYQNELPNDAAGASLSALPDVDGDGFGDFLVGAPYNSQGNYDAGKTYLVHGQPGAISATYVRRQPGGNPIPEDFSSVRLSIDYAGGSSSIDVATLNRALPPNPSSPNQGTTLPMEWVIETDRLGPWTATVTFEYTNGELGGASESHLVVHQSPNGAPGSWQVAGISQARDPNRNVIRVQGIDSFSHFTIVDISTGGSAPMVSLPEALDNYDLTWITGGDAPWFGVGETTFNPNGETSFDGFDAARSGLIHDNETSFLSTEVVGPGTAGFYWRLSSETPFDTLEFYVDDALQGQFSGEIPWHPASIEVPSGPHTLKAVYSKNGSGSSGEDAARIDLASWTPVPPPPVSCPVYVSGGAGLQAAINAATSGCLIEIVDSLTYAEDLYIPPSKTNLTIRAATGETPTIRAANTTGGRGLVDLWFQLVGASGAPDHAGMIVEGNGATLRGLTFENDGPVNTVYNWNSAILVMADHVTLEGCTIRGSTFIPGDRVGLLVASGDWTNLETVTGPIFSSAGYGIVRCDHLTMSECTLDRGGIGLATVDYANALGLLLTGQTYYNPVVHPQDGSFTNCDFIGMNFAAQNAVGKGFVYQYCNILENDASFQQEGGNASFVNCRFSRSFIGQELFAVQADLGYGGGVADITCTNCVFCGGRMEMVEVTTANAIFSGCVFTNEATESVLPCILYNPEEFGPEFYTLPAPFEGARPTSLLVDHCDFHIPNSIAIGTNSGPYNPPHPPSSLQVTNSVIVSDRPISIINSTFVPGTTLDIQYNDLFTTGTQVVNTSGWPGTIANNLNVDPYFVDPNRCEQDGFLYANPSLGNAASDGGPIGSQGRWPIGGLAETDQPMLGRSPQHTGFTDRVGPEIEPEILWEAAPGLAQAAFATQAILDGSGNIYVNYGNVDSAPAPRQENFISFDSSGLERWRFGPISDVLRFGLSTAALNLGGQVVAAFRDDYARSFASATGTLSWETPVQGSLSPPAVDRFGFIYVSGAKLDPLDGSILWQFSGGTNSAMALSLDQRTVYFGQSATLYALDAGSGNVNWSFSPSPAARFGYGAPVVGADGTVYLSERTTGDFFAFEDNGYSVVVKWVFPTNHPGDSPRRSGLDQDTVYLGTVGSDVVLHAIGLDGVPKWSREFPSGTYVGDPCITDAAVYVTVDSEGGLYALDRDDGSLLWRRQVSPPGASFSEGVTLTDNGVLYVGTNGTLANPDQAVLVALQASSTPCLAVTLPEALSYPRGNQVTIPVEVGPVSDLSAITGLEVRFDPTILSLPSEDRLAPSSLLPDDWLIFANASEPGVVLVSGTGITPASGSGPLLTLTFDIVGNPGLCAPIFLSVGSFEDSNGASICTNTNDGWFCVTSEGTVTVEVEPDAGSWTLTGPEGFAPRAGSGDQTFSNAPVGMYTVTFDPLPGYITPPPASGELSSLGVLILSGSYTPTGSVSVEVEPDSATWTLTGPNGFAPYMGAGDETLPNAPVGAYQLVFDPLPNHLTPPPATGELVAFGSLILSGTYTPTGTVNVEVEPNSATWTLTGPVGFAPYSGSGDVSVPDAPVGNYSVAFDPLPGYLTPTSANGSLAPFGSLILSGTYTPTGVVSVQVEPDAATWTLTGPAGFSPQSSSGDQSFSDVPEGIYSLTFDPLPGYITPPSATGELAAFGSLILSGTYTPTGAVTVEVDPDSATWTLTGPAGFTPQAGAGDQTFPGVPVGIYTATFDPLPEYITPPSASGELTAFGALILSGTYTPTGTITVDVDPDVATWTLTGPTLFGSHSGAGDETIDDAPVGDYQVVFHAVSDYITPTSDSGALAASETLAFSGIYTPLLDISGRVAYCHDLASKPVPDATLELSPGWSERTDSTGLYAFESLPAGVSYMVTATRAIQPGDVAIPSITAFDASLILRHTVGLVVLNACQLNAADVNRSNTVTAFDASQILRFTVGLIPAPFVWLIEPPSRSYNPLLSDQFNQDYSAVLTGDVNGSWIYTGGAKSLEDSVSLKANSLEAPEAELSLGEHAGERGAHVIVELQATVDQLQAFTDLRITFDPAVLTVQGPSGATLAAPLEGWTLLSNAGEDPGLIRLSASGSAPVSASGAIVEILMEVIGAPGATSPLSLV